MGTGAGVQRRQDAVWTLHGVSRAPTGLFSLHQTLLRRGGGLLALRPTPKKLLTQNLAEGKSSLKKRPLCGTHPDGPPDVLIPYKQNRAHTPSPTHARPLSTLRGELLRGGRNEMAGGEGSNG